MKKYYLNESTILDVIKQVLKENRKVIKLPSQNQPQSDMSMGADMGMNMGMNDPMAQQAPDMENDMNGGMGNMDDDMNGGQDDSSQFDTNFDAGVEADEESDPKHYIQQLTGKLSQSLNSYNSEQGPDAGLSKYVASMIITATCKNLDDKAKKEMIEKINSAQSEDDMNDDGDDGNEDIENGDIEGGDNMADDMGNDINTDMPQQTTVRKYRKESITEVPAE